MKKKIAILGFGTVGKGVYDMIRESCDYQCAYVLDKPENCKQPFMVSSLETITNDSSVEAVVECMGGIDAAFAFVRACLKAKKHVITSNKALVAAKGIELNKLAKENKVGFMFSAACGGAIPILHNISIAKKTDNILSCQGIMNGTTNFILSGLKDGSFKDYKEALKKAQELGYAEADPTADVSGLDTLRKVILLSAVSFNILPTGGFDREGIENIDLLKDKEAVVKLVGRCGLNKDGSVYAYTEPVICNEKSIYRSVNSNFNAISYIGKNSGNITLFGQGAGKYPTASAILRDISAIFSNQLEMLESSCKEGFADNSQVMGKYLVCTEEKTWTTDLISVSQMHKDAKEMRENNKKVFFARIEDDIC